jgi:predicted amidohydrolase YtcJ
MKTTNSDLTLDICTEDGSRARFYQNDEPTAEKTLRQLVSPRLFNPPLLTLTSEHSVSAIPTRTIDMILAHTASPPPLPLPSGWVDAVEVNDEALCDLADLEAAAAAENKHVMLVEIHTLGDWMIRLKLETMVPETLQEKRHLWNHLLDLPAIPFRLKAGGIGAINPANIVRATVCPPIDGVAETALSADLLESVRA